jgi:carboxyl-terminal processing protease
MVWRRSVGTDAAQRNSSLERGVSGLIRRYILLGIVLACLGSFLIPSGCMSLFAQGSYRRIGHQTLDGLADGPKQTIQSALSAGDAAARAARLWDAARTFERDGQFDAAVVAYEETRRTDVIPAATLDERVRWCKARLVVESRWTDDKLRASAEAIDREKGLALYREVVRTIRGNYVDEVPFQQMTRAGFDNLRAAMASKTFAEKFRLTDAGAKKAAFLAALDALALELGGETDMNSFTARYFVRRACEENQRTLGLPDGVVISEFLFAAAEHLDAYTVYLTQEMYSALNDDLEGHFVGLGIEVRKRDELLRIVTVFDGSPAAKAGLAVGDVIVGVDDRRVGDAGLGAVISMLRGPQGSQVRVTVSRAGAEQTFSVTRSSFDVPSVRGATRVGDGGRVGYVRIVNFQKSTGMELSRALANLERQGPMEGLVLDLRDNPGGLLTAAVDVCNLFIDSGDVVSTKGRGFMQSQVYRVSHWQFEQHKAPLVVLVDGSSASSSEIVAGALKDHKRATLVGSRTYGKGVVQSVIPVEVGLSAVYLTSARFYGPAGKCFHGIGIEPDVAVSPSANEPATDHADPAGDAVLRKALDVLAAARQKAPAADRVAVAPAK